MFLEFGVRESYFFQNPFSRSQWCIKFHICLRQPISTLYEWCHSEFPSLFIWKSGLITSPTNPFRHIWSRPIVVVLSIENGSGWLNIGDPFFPAQWVQKIPKSWLHNDSGWELLPWPTKICGCSKIGTFRRKCAFLDRNASVLIWVFLSLSSDGVELIGKRLPWLDVAVLEDHSSIAKYEVYGTCNVAFFVELAIGVGVKGVLESIKWTLVEHGLVRAWTECHCLMLCCSCCVNEAYAFCNKAFSRNSYMKFAI